MLLHASVYNMSDDRLTLNPLLASLFILQEYSSLFTLNIMHTEPYELPELEFRNNEFIAILSLF